MNPDEHGPRLLDEAALEYLSERGEEMDFVPGQVVLRRGDTGRWLWVVLSGEVEARRDPGHRYIRFGPSESFGALAILRSEPVSADFVAATAVRLLRFPAELLPTALAENESLRRSLLRRLADMVHLATSQVWELTRRTRVLEELGQARLPSGEMVASSGLMRRVGASISKAATHLEPVLISGEPGTGKLLAARIIHESSGRSDGPLIAVDCGSLSAPEASGLLLGGPQAGSGGGDSFGALHLAHGGTLVLRGIEDLAEPLQHELALHLDADKGAPDRPFPDVRLVVTLESDGARSEVGGLASSLQSQLTTTISLPTLAARGRDIVPLARAFLKEIDTTGSLTLSPAAERALLTRKYRHGNADELRSVVELAARITDSAEIRAEHVFSGYDSERPVGLDVTRFWFVQWLIRKRGIGWVRGAVALFFLTIAVVCLTVGATTVGAVANGLVWAIWEPVVFGSFLLVGSLWCTVCPLSSSGRFVQRLFTLGRPPPAWMPRWGSWISAIGLVLILWSAVVFDMLHRPFGTGVLLLALVLSAIVCCAIWQREVWCRHLCPLGRLGVALAPVAPVTVAARRSVCTTTCQTHDCYKGNSQLPGCPVFHHPQLIGESHRCKTCLTCLRTCPHGSAGLYLRPRLRSAWRLPSVESYVIPVALAVFLVSPLLVLRQVSGRLGGWLELTLACILALFVAAFGSWFLTPLLQRGRRSTALPAAVACALLVLGWGPLMAYQMGHIPPLESLSLAVAEGGLMSLLLPSSLPLVVILRLAFVLFAAVLSATILWNALGRARHSGRQIRWLGWFALIATCTAYTAICLFLATR